MFRFRILVVTVVAIASAVFTLAATAPAASAGTTAAHVGYGVVRPRNSRGGIQPRGLPHLHAFGGHVLKNVKVYGVKWGTGTYASAIDANTAPSIADFFTKVTASSYIDSLSEYSMPGEVIGRGSFQGITAVTPASGNAGALTDATIESDLAAQIGTALPSPDANTLYVLFFPNSVSKITLGTNDTSTNTCGYHNTFTNGGHTIRYVVLPDQATAACQDATLDGLTWVASHELIESITDPDVGLASSWGPPLGWDDPYVPGGGAEIADICELWNDAGGLVANYFVSGGWSNQQGRCTTAGPKRTISVGNAWTPEGNDALHPRTLYVPITLSASSNTNVTVTYTLSNGTATAGRDYVLANGSRTFAAADLSRTPTKLFIPIRIIGDKVRERNETIHVHIASTSLPYVVTTANATATILNDD